MKMLQGKAALVTGGSSGIGRAVALAYAREGAQVLVADKNPKDEGGTCAEIAKLGGKAAYFQADVSNPEACRRMVEAAGKAFGRLDIACNNAGIGGELHPTGEYGPEAWN